MFGGGGESAANFLFVHQVDRNSAAVIPVVRFGNDRVAKAFSGGNGTFRGTHQFLTLFKNGTLRCVPLHAPYDKIDSRLVPRCSIIKISA